MGDSDGACGGCLRVPPGDPAVSRGRAFCEGLRGAAALPFASLRPPPAQRLRMRMGERRTYACMTSAPSRATLAGALRCTRSAPRADGACFLGDAHRPPSARCIGAWRVRTDEPPLEPEPPAAGAAAAGPSVAKGEGARAASFSRAQSGKWAQPLGAFEFLTGLFEVEHKQWF